VIDRWAVNDLLGIIAFALLWLFLAGFFVVLFGMLRAEAGRIRRGERIDWEHGL
jgi:hypothetical protein